MTSVCVHGFVGLTVKLIPDKITVFSLASCDTFGTLILQLKIAAINILTQYKYIVKYQTSYSNVNLSNNSLNNNNIVQVKKYI